VPEGAADADLACLARNVYHEARGEPTAGMVAVGQVVMNRARGGRTPCQVVAERRGRRCQFSWACGGPSAIREPDAWQRSMAVAASLLAATAPPDTTGGATFFSLCRISSGSVPGRVLTARIGSHCFFRSLLDTHAGGEAPLARVRAVRGLARLAKILAARRAR
jgi:spore germination cell wall hydrolase CwlJ-like protein